MYVAQQAGTSTYVIGIAGTDFHSLYDWAVEDLDMIPFAGEPQSGVSLSSYLATLTSQPVTIYVAGHSLGDATWAAHFTSTFPNGQRVWNSLDVVPHAWQASMMEQIGTLYGTVAAPNAAEALAIDAAVKKAKDHDYTQALGNGTGVTGTMQVNLSTFASQAYFQHICAYYGFIGVTPPSSSGCSSL